MLIHESAGTERTPQTQMPEWTRWHQFRMCPPGVTCQVMQQVINEVSHYGVGGHYDHHHPSYYIDYTGWESYSISRRGDVVHKIHLLLLLLPSRQLEELPELKRRLCEVWKQSSSWGVQGHIWLPVHVLSWPVFETLFMVLSAHRKRWSFGAVSLGDERFIVLLQICAPSLLHCECLENRWYRCTREEEEEEEEAEEGNKLSIRTFSTSSGCRKDEWQVEMCGWCETESTVSQQWQLPVTKWLYRNVVQLTSKAWYYPCANSYNLWSRLESQNSSFSSFAQRVFGPGERDRGEVNVGQTELIGLSLS